MSGKSVAAERGWGLIRRGGTKNANRRIDWQRLAFGFDANRWARSNGATCLAERDRSKCTCINHSPAHIFEPAAGAAHSQTDAKYFKQFRKPSEIGTKEWAMSQCFLFLPQLIPKMILLVRFARINNRTVLLTLGKSFRFIRTPSLFISIDFGFECCTQRSQSRNATLDDAANRPFFVRWKLIDVELL